MTPASARISLIRSALAPLGISTVTGRPGSTVTVVSSLATEVPIRFPRLAATETIATAATTTAPIAKMGRSVRQTDGCGSIGCIGCASGSCQFEGYGCVGLIPGRFKRLMLSSAGG